MKERSLLSTMQSYRLTFLRRTEQVSVVQICHGLSFVALENIFSFFVSQYNDLSFIEIGEDGTLRILGVQDMDGGEYTCMATNQAGSVQTKVTLNVGCKDLSRCPDSVYLITS